jgi:translation initiation factor IF-2
MAVRIYQLSKDVGMDNAELIELLRKRGYEVKSASSTVDNISAQSLREEFGPGEEPATAVAPVEAPVAPIKPVAPAFPPGVAIVRSKEDIEQERRKREEEERSKAAARVILPPPPVVGKAPPALPRMPAPAVRQVPPPPAVNRPPLAPATRPQPRPVLRTDLPPVREVAATAAPEVKPAVAQPEKPPATQPGPAPLPPRVPSVKMPPAIIAPPRVTQPAGAAEHPETAGPAAAPADLKPLQVKSPIVVRDFAVLVGKKPFQLISELMELNIFASMNTAIEEDIATRIALRHGFALEVRHRGEAAAQPVKVVVAPTDAAELLEPRPPVVCILGHVDHGKTTLLDAIRHTNVVAGEPGGITQHIGAYQVEHRNRKITFIDTPGHAAFSNMRARGANVTDIAVLVVAADDGFMPQTDEALGHARAAKVPVVVAINKIDAPGANLDRVKRQLQERNLSPEDWGGETLVASVSALKGQGIENLLEAIILQTDITEGISANPNANTEGVVLEAQKELGRGSTASVIVRKGTLKPGQALVCGDHHCRVRQLFDEHGRPVREAGPATPVKVVGWSGTPDAGDVFSAVKNEREARRLAEENERARKQLVAAERPETQATVDDLFAAIARTHKNTYRVLVKADVYGTAEALATSLLNIHSDKIDIEVVDMGVGDVTRNDVHMASAAQCSIVCFNVGQESGVTSFAKHHGIVLIQHNIIYELIDQVKDAMADLLEPEIREVKIGAAQVRQVFPLAKSWVAGCMVTEGKIQRDAIARLLRKGKQVADSTVATLKRFKDDATEVRAGYECGIQLAGVNTYEEGDLIEVFEIHKIKPVL